MSLKSQVPQAVKVNDSPFKMSKKRWTEQDVDILITCRCATDPPTFKNIARQLNELNFRMGKETDREFTTRDCINKWSTLFPRSEDANKTVAWLSRLKKCWPGLHFETESQPSADENLPPQLTGLYIVWPWSREVMRTLTSSIFCDATFEVTVFNYKIVLITTLDGNKQHRPLMCFFILRSISSQWAKIFNIFNM